MTRQCEACKHWDKSETRKAQRVEYGICHRFPTPQPSVRADAWCGEFSAAERRSVAEQMRDLEASIDAPAKPKPAKASRSRKSGASK